MQAAAANSAPTTPWYRQGWPWFLIAFPAIAVVAGAITLWLAVSTDDGQVIADYYKKGKAIEESLTRLEKARELGLSADVQLTAEQLRLSLQARPGYELPRELIVTLARPAQGNQDQVLRLRAEGNVYQGPVHALGIGHWNIYIEDELRAWRLNGATYLPTETQFRIVPAPEPSSVR